MVQFNPELTIGNVISICSIIIGVILAWTRIDKRITLIEETNSRLSRITETMLADSNEMQSWRHEHSKWAETVYKDYERRIELLEEEKS